MKKILSLEWCRRLCVILLLISFLSCNKNPEKIGDNLQPDRNQIQLVKTDTVSIVAYSVIDDSIRTDEASNMLMGSIKDPVFGTVVAGFYTQVRLSTNGHSFGTNPQLDSLVLQLTYSNYYGDTTTSQTLQVFELEEDLNIDSAYYSNFSKQTGSMDYANYSFMPHPNAPFVFGEDTLAPAIRVRLSDISPELGNKILQIPDTELDSNVNFKEVFKGLYITAQATTMGGAISYFNLPTVTTALSIYYSNDTDDSLRYDFYMTSTEARFNRYQHFGYQDANQAFKSQVVDKDTLLGQQLLYAQAMGGIKTKLRFPTLVAMKKATGDNLIINEAKLIFSAYNNDENFTPPSQVALLKDNGEGGYEVLPDQFEGDAYFGGTYKASVKEYQFRITRYVQDMVLRGEDRDDFGLYMIVYGASAKADRWVFNGTTPVADTLKPLRLELTYSVVDSN